MIRDVYIVLIQTKQMDLHIGAAYMTRREADKEVERIEKSNAFNDAYWIKREVEEPEEQPARSAVSGSTSREPGSTDSRQG